METEVQNNSLSGFELKPSIWDEETEEEDTSHTGINVFQKIKALRHFNKESILYDEELDENKIDQFAKNTHTITFAIEKIFYKQMSLKNECNKSKVNVPGPSQSSVSCDASSEKALSKHAQSIKKFNIDLSLAVSNKESQSPSSNIKNSLPTTEQESPSHSLFTEVTGSIEDENETADLVSLFWLMSILPEPAATRCKQVMDKDHHAWKINLYDVILVLLNWGGTLESLDLEILTPCSLFSPKLQPLEQLSQETSFPSHSNVTLVLNAIAERLPSAKSPYMSDLHRVLLVKILVYAALDCQHRQSMFNYCHTIRIILESFQPWATEQAAFLVKYLNLRRLVVQSAMFVSCSMFNMMSCRLSLVGSLAAHEMLQEHFHLPQSASFSELVEHLIFPPELLQRYTLRSIYIIAGLLHSLLVRNIYMSSSNLKKTVASLHTWTVDVRGALTQHPYTLSSGYVRERLCRLTSECAAIMRNVYKTSILQMANRPNIYIDT